MNVQHYGTEGFFNINLSNMSPRVRVCKFDSPHDPLGRFNIYSTTHEILLAEDLTLVEVRRMLRERGWTLDIE